MTYDEVALLEPLYTPYYDFPSIRSLGQCGLAPTARASVSRVAATGIRFRRPIWYARLALEFM